MEQHRYIPAWTAKTPVQVRGYIRSVLDDPHHGKPITVQIVEQGEDENEALTFEAGVFNGFEFDSPYSQLKCTHPELFQAGVDARLIN